MLRMPEVHSFVRLNNILSYAYATFYLFLTNRHLEYFHHVAFGTSTARSFGVQCLLSVCWCTVSVS